MTDTAAVDSQPEALVYACSGASNLGQLTNEIAIRLDRAGLAEMSCAEAAGIEAGAPYAAARSGRPIVFWPSTVSRSQARSSSRTGASRRQSTSRLGARTANESMTRSRASLAPCSRHNRQFRLIEEGSPQ